MGICYGTPDHVSQQKVGYDLPEEMVMEIISWLPVKSLMRFRCISKFWCSLMNDSSFITKHLKHQEADMKKNGRLLVQSYDLASEKYIFSLFPEGTLALPHYRYPDLELKNRATVLGPCNGIFCLFNGLETVALWNPATRQFRTLPRLPPPLASSILELLYSGFGFGMDPKTNDFKVIVIVVSMTMGEQRKHVGVFSLSSGSWRVLDGNCVPVRDVCHSEFYSYANGFYYWFAADKDGWFILSFDMINEVFQAIPDPDGIPESVKELSYQQFAIYDNSIAQILYDEEEEEERCYSIWVLKGGCWIKEVTFGALRVESRTGELLVSDPVTGEIKNVGIHNPDQVFTYCESLVSLGGGNYSTGEDLQDFLQDELRVEGTTKKQSQHLLIFLPLCSGPKYYNLTRHSVKVYPYSRSPLTTTSPGQSQLILSQSKPINWATSIGPSIGLGQLGFK